jgi:hypothetical protein
LYPHRRTPNCGREKVEHDAHVAKTDEENDLRVTFACLFTHTHTHTHTCTHTHTHTHTHTRHTAHGARHILKRNDKNDYLYKNKSRRNTQFSSCEALSVKRSASIDTHSHTPVWWQC